MNTALGDFAASLILPVVALPIGWLLGVLVRRIRTASWQRYWRTQMTVYAEYEAPDGLRPAEIAFLYDRSFGEPELLATIFDLELRNKVTLNPVKSENGPDFTIRLHTKPLHDSSLSDFEQEVLLSIKALGSAPRWSELKADAAIWDSGIERNLEFSLRQQGYFWHVSPARRMKWWLIAIGAICALITIVLPMMIGDNWVNRPLPSLDNPHEVLGRELSFFIASMFWLGATILYALTAWGVYAAYHRGLDLEAGTKRLQLIWPHLEGFRVYLQVVEQDRLHFANKTLKEQAREKALPYAVALNLSTSWQARFRE